MSLRLRLTLPRTLQQGEVGSHESVPHHVVDFLDQFEVRHSGRDDQKRIFFPPQLQIAGLGRASFVRKERTYFFEQERIANVIRGHFYNGQLEAEQEIGGFFIHRGTEE